MTGNTAPRWKGSPCCVPGAGTPSHILVFDLETGEGAIFAVWPGGDAASDLRKHRFGSVRSLSHSRMLYEQPKPFDVPPTVELPNAPADLYGYRRPGPEGA